MWPLLQHKHDWDIWEFIQQYSFDNALEIQLVWTVTAQQLRNASFLPQHKPQTNLAVHSEEASATFSHSAKYGQKWGRCAGKNSHTYINGMITIYCGNSLCAKSSFQDQQLKIFSKMHLEKLNKLLICSAGLKANMTTGSTHCFGIKLTIR